MAWMPQFAIVVTSETDAILKAHAKAVEIFASVSDVTPSRKNNSRSFLIPPDGDWWSSDDEFKRRSVFKNWLRERRTIDSLFSIDWVEMQFGHFSSETKVLDHSNFVFLENVKPSVSPP